MNVKALILAGAAASLLAACGGQDSPERVEYKPSVPVTTAQKVAAIDEGMGISSDDVRVTRIDYLLKTLSARSGDSEDTITDRAGYGSHMLKNKFGVEVKIATMLQDMNEAYDETGIRDSARLTTLVIAYHAKKGD